MRKGFQLATLAGALTIAMSGSVSAVTLDFGGWTVGGTTGGEIDHIGDNSTPGAGSVCTQEGVSCSVVASGAGFKQINVADINDTTGTSYIMTIVTDQDAVGAPGGIGFYDVSFVKMKLTLGGAADPTENGIAAHQEINEATTVGAGSTFKSTSDINTGWANTAGSPIVITQDLIDNGATDAGGDDFASGFLYRANADATTGQRTGFEMNIDQFAGLATATDAASANDVQVFALREKQGDMLTVAPAAGNPIDLNGDGTPVTWTAGQDIKAIWIGQQINLDSTTPGTTPVVGSLGSTFGYLSFDNLDDAAAAETSFGFSAANATGAWKWDPAFNMTIGSGTQTQELGTPCLADRTGNTSNPEGPTGCAQLP